MPVIIEAQSIVIPVNTILNRYEGSWENFKREIPNDSFCCDNKLVRVGFMDPTDGIDYLNTLLARGLRYARTEEASPDFATIDQIEGFITPCDWAELRRARVDDNPDKTILACRAAGDTSTLMAVPDGWEFQDSLSDRCLTFESGRESEHFNHTGHEGRFDLCRNLAIGPKQLRPAGGSVCRSAQLAPKLSLH